MPIDTNNQQTPPSQMAPGFGPAAKQNARNIPLIIRREYRARATSRGFLFGTIFLVGVVVAMAFLPTLIDLAFATTQTKLAVINMAGTVAGQDPDKQLEALLNATPDNTTQTAQPAKLLFDLKVGQPQEIDTLRQQVRDGELSGLLILQRPTGPAGNLAFEYYTNESLASTNPVLIQAAIKQLDTRDKLSRLGINASQQQAFESPPVYQVKSALEERSGRTQDETSSALIIVIVSIMLLATCISMYGSSIAAGVAEEKGSRIMEIMITAATPFQLMVGKIVGAGLAGLTQIGAMAVFGVASFLVQIPLRAALLSKGSNLPQVNLTNFSITLIGMMVIYFILGFLLYGTLYAIAGAVVSRPEDIGSVSGPIGLLMTAGYIVSFPAVVMPEAPWVVFCSYIPFFTPTLMLARMGLGATPIAWWEIVLSSLIMLVTILIFAWFAARIYRIGVLMYGQAPSLGKVVQLLLSR